MSSRTYMPYIDGAIEHITRVYDWNQKVDLIRWVINMDYNFNNWLLIYYEEKNEYTQAKLNNDKEEMVDALIDQFIVAIGEIRKCSLSDNYEHIEFWEDEANNAYGSLDGVCFDIAEARLASDEPIAYADISKLSDDIMNACITEVLDALYSRFGDDAYIDSNNKFIKSKSYRKPNLSSILWHK